MFSFESSSRAKFSCENQGVTVTTKCAFASGKTAFTGRAAAGQNSGTMRKTLRLGGLIAATFLAGCGTTSTITQLSPRIQTRNAEGLYPVEIEFRSNMQALKKETLKPYLQVGESNYPMRRTLRMENRWETLLPVPASTNVANYRVKVDFDYNAIPVSKPSSVLSQPYQLQIREK